MDASSADCGRSAGALASIHSTHEHSAAGTLGRDAAQRRDGLVDVPVEHRHRRVRAVEGRLSREQLVGHDADRVEVGVRADLLGERLLRGHVRGRPHRHAGVGEPLRQRVVGARDAEVGELDPAAERDEHVLGLEVAVRDGVLLGVIQAGEHPVEHAEHLRRRERADVRSQRPAGDELHRDVRHAVGLEEVVERDDVRVREGAGHLPLEHEAVRDGRIVARDLDPLQRDVAIERGLPGQVDHGHASARDDPDDLVAADALPGHLALFPA